MKVKLGKPVMVQCGKNPGRFTYCSFVMTLASIIVV